MYMSNEMLHWNIWKLLVLEKIANVIVIILDEFYFPSFLKNKSIVDWNIKYKNLNSINFWELYKYVLK